MQILEVREAAEPASEVVERELAAHAVQHADEAARVLDVGDDRVLGDLEAHLAGVHAGAVEAVDHELQELQVAERLAGDVDRDAALRAELEGAVAERGERGLHHPAVHQ